MIKRILMVDDDTDDQEFFKLIVRQIDPSIEVYIENAPAKAIENLLSKARPDVIFLDMLMPDVDGIECLTKLKANRNTSRIPVVLFTGSDDKNEINLALKLGATDLVRKTANIDNAVKNVRQVILNIDHTK